MKNEFIAIRALYESFVNPLIEGKLDLPGKGDFRALVAVKGNHIRGIASNKLYHDDLAHKNPKLFGFKEMPKKYVFRPNIMHQDLVVHSGTPKKPNPHKVFSIRRSGNELGIEHHTGVSDEHVRKVTNHVMNAVPSIEKVHVTNIQGKDFAGKSDHYSYSGWKEIDNFVKRGHTPRYKAKNSSMPRISNENAESCPLCYIKEVVKERFLQKK